MQQADYLEALGIVQYRRRALQTINSAINSDLPISEVGDVPAPAAPEEVVPSIARSPEPIQKPSSPIANADNKVEARADELLSFDLLIWKTDKLLVWEFSQQETGLSDTKHRLVNNILRALWPDNFQGAEMLLQSWPLAGSNAGKVDASTWLGSMLSGHQEKGAGKPVWLMGDVGIELLLGKQDSLEDIVGNRIKHPELEIEIFVGASPQAMFENPIAKAQTWQMLRDMRNG